MTQPNRLRIGVVGAGLVAHVAHLPELRARPDRFDVVAIADPSAAARERAALAWGLPQTYADHRELLADASVDAILVCSPNGTHSRVALDALAAGVHVLVEKPLCIAPEDGERIAAVAAERGLVAQAGYMKRFDPAYEAMLADLASGARVLHVATETYDPGLRQHFAPAGLPIGDDVAPQVAAELAASTEEQASRAAGADNPGHARALSDVFLGALIHDVNLVRGLLASAGDAAGEVLEAFCGHDPSRAGGTVELAGGGRWTMVWLELPGIADFGERIVAYAADSVRSLDFPAPYLRGAPTVLTLSRGRRGGNERRTIRSWQEAYGRQLEHFHACVTEGASCRAPAADAVEDLRLLCRMFRAATRARGGAQVTA